MPVGNFSNKHTSYYKVTKPQDGRCFIVGGTKESPVQVNYIEGIITKIDTKVDEWEGQEIHKINIYFTDKNESSVDVLQFGKYTSFARDVINSLASIEKWGYIRITPYVSIDEKTNKEYVHAAIRNNGDKVKRKYFEEIPKVETVKVGKKDVLDTEKRDKFFDDLLVSFNEKIKHTEVIVKPGLEELVSDDDDENVPF